MPNLTWRDAIIHVLGNAEEEMHYTAIAEAIAEQQLRTEFGATPASSVNSVIAVSIRDEGESSPFIKVGRGYYALRETTCEIGRAHV